MRRPEIAVVCLWKSGDYVQSVERAGAEARLVDPSEPPPASLWRDVAGLMLTGGPDVDPVLYREPADPMYEPATAGRDACEIEMAIRAVERDLPMLAICRGLQVLNVANGGTLIQHIPAQVPQSLNHELVLPRWAVAHEVDVDPQSLLSKVMTPRDGEPVRSLPVNSRHHQAAKHVAPGLVGVATAPDGVVEALERPASRFCVGIQWHPENFWRTGEFDALFRAFVDACR